MYSEEHDILTILPGLPQTSTVSGYTATVEIVRKHQPRADNMINGKISSRYDVSTFQSIGSVPPLIQTIAEDIVSYYTYRSLFSGDNQNANEWTDKFHQAIEMLDQIRNGDLDLVNSTGSIIATRDTEVITESILSNTKDYAPSFGEDSVTSWAVDSDKTSDLESDRS